MIFFLLSVFLKLAMGKKTRFWVDVWLGEQPLAQQYPSLCNIVQQKNVLIADA
jgi:hypothetical protein